MNDLTDPLIQFASDLHQHVLTEADSAENGGLLEDAFTQYVSGMLIDAGEIEELTVCPFHARGQRATGYNVCSDEETADLFISLYQRTDPPTRIGKTDIDNAVRHLRTFLQNSFRGTNKSIEESSPAFDMAIAFHELKEQLTHVRLFVLTDSICTLNGIESEEVDGIQTSVHIWDIVRLHRLTSSGRGHEDIAIDIVGEFGSPIPCLPIPCHDADYKPYLGIVPGEMLARIYDRYGPRLLERNVRAFLEAKGKVNRGIRKTILEEPERFLAYNNGIAATADEVDIVSLADGGSAIVRINNLQIVNGGQTIASLHRALRKDKADLSKVYVQMKLSVVSATLIDEVVPRISLFANTQNKVSLTDFSSNDPFHVKLEELSRTVWAPAKDGGQRQSHWFYERARGQYSDEKGRRSTHAQRRAFEAENPSKQKFTKIDLAKFENTWDQYPHSVSLGAEKNFRRFMVRLQERGGLTPDVCYFERLVAKAILFRETERIVRSLDLGGYRANVVTYTMAWLSHHTAQRIDLDEIWRHQGLSELCITALTAAAPVISREIVSGAGQGNVTEYCKKESCWKSIQDLNIKFPEGFSDEFVKIGSTSSAVPVPRPGALVTDEEAVAIAHVSQLSSASWFALSKWAKETGNLRGFQRSMAYNIGKALGRGTAPSGKLAVQGVKILEEAKRLGFSS